MASLVEDLLDVMQRETENYQKLYTLAEQKRRGIMDRDLEKIEQTSSEENEISSELKNLESKRVRVLKDMSVVLGKDNDDKILTVTEVILLLNKQKAEQEALTKARDSLVKAATQMQFLNEQNQILLEQAMEMVEFDLTLFKSLRQAPQTANYGQDAYTTGDILGGSSFDSSQ